MASNALPSPSGRCVLMALPRASQVPFRRASTANLADRHHAHDACAEAMGDNEPVAAMCRLCDMALEVLLANYRWN
jgi:hypothetical protein